MRIVITALLMLGGILFLFIGTNFLINPASMGPDFGLDPIGNQGLSTVRGDMTAIFWVTGGGMIWGSWKRRGDFLLASAAIMGVIFFGRCVSLALDGSYEGWVPPMTIEALTVVLCLAGWKMLRDNKPA